MQEPITQPEGQYASALVHPEKIRASVEFRIGNSVSLNAMVRMMPAGLVTIGVMVATIVLSIAALVRAIRHPG
jgi:hypothetical protein